MYKVKSVTATKVKSIAKSALFWNLGISIGLYYCGDNA